MAASAHELNLASVRRSGRGCNAAAGRGGAGNEDSQLACWCARVCGRLPAGGSPTLRLRGCLVSVFLVTGNPGSGKSALTRELKRRGLLAIDPDDDLELAHWQDTAGRRVPGPPRPDEDWLRSHRWVWSRSALEQILAGSGQAVFVCGIARNQDELLGLFDRVLLLRIDARTQEARLAAHDAARPPGRSEAARQEIRQGRVMFEAQMIEAGAIALDGTAPTASVADELLALVAAT